MSGGTPSGGGGSSAVIAGGEMSFPYSTTLSDYTKTGTITFSSFESNGNVGQTQSNTSVSPTYTNAPTRTSYWTASTTQNFNDVYIVDITPAVSYSVGFTLSWVSTVATFTDGTTQNLNQSGQQTLNKNLNKTVTTYSGGYRTNYPQVNWSASTTYREGNSAGDIQNEAEVGTQVQVNPSAENNFGSPAKHIFGADIENGALDRTTCTQYKVEVWNGSAWIQVRTLGNTLGKMRWNGVTGEKIKITGTDSTAKRLSLQKLRIFYKEDSDLFNHGHTKIDPTETLPLDGIAT